jgi:hypothetical protein
MFRNIFNKIFCAFCNDVQNSEYEIIVVYFRLVLT